MNGGNETALPVCAAFKKNFKFFLHCLCDFTGQPELGIEQNREAVERALQHINQLTVDRPVRPQVDRQFLSSRPSRPIVTSKAASRVVVSS